MEFREILASVAPTVFNDSSTIDIINAWSVSRGYLNYADCIAFIIKQDIKTAIDWARLKAANDLSFDELANSVKNNAIVQNVVDEPIIDETVL